jgi:hypothetical protein
MERNIKVEIYRKKNELQCNNKLIILTHYKKNDVNIMNSIQKKCFLENANNTSVDEVHIMGENLYEELKTITSNKKIVLHEIIPSSSSSFLSYYDLLSYCNTTLSNNIVCILRSDIILPNQSNLDPIDFHLLYEKKDVYCLSRIEHSLDGKLLKYDKLNKLFYSTEQDACLFPSPLELTQSTMELCKSIYFHHKYSELQFNFILKKNDYNIINDTTKYKIFRIMNDNNLESRLLLHTEKKIDEIENIYILPDNELFQKISVDNFLSSFEIDQKDLYFIKCELFNKYAKTKIVNGFK